MAKYANNKEENLRLEPIPKERLEAYYRRVCGDIACMFIKAMAASGLAPETADRRLGRPLGHTMRYINDLIKGKITKLKDMTDIACALEVELDITSKPISTYRSKAIAGVDEFERKNYNYTKDRFDPKPLPTDPFVLIDFMDTNLQMNLCPAGLIDWEYVICWRYVTLTRNNDEDGTIRNSASGYASDTTFGSTAEADAGNSGSDDELRQSENVPEGGGSDSN